MRALEVVLTTLADLAGKRIGVPEYQMTAALWMRGLLSDEYGVSPAGIHWRTGALDAGVRHERLSLDLPEGMVVEPIRDGGNAAGSLASWRYRCVACAQPSQSFPRRQSRG